MTQTQREVTNHIEFQLSLLRLVAVPQSYGSVRPEVTRPGAAQEKQLEDLIGVARKVRP
ncbi:MAG: hypothetical protein SFV51_18975 [Bryobacteraceae bacterium]|nr:hypothetical protein [Bryobacteraceae bacterium]